MARSGVGAVIYAHPSILSPRSGLPLGAEFDYADTIFLARAFQHRIGLT